MWITKVEEPNLNKKTSYRLEPFFDLSVDLFCIAGFDGYFRRINPAVSSLLGYTEEELYQRPISEFIYEEDKKLTANHRKELVNGVPLLNFENRYVTKSGEIVWLAWTSMPLMRDQLVYAIAKNITYKKKLEEERNQLLTNLTDINQHLRQITYATSHDLRSPVNNLMAIFDLIDTTKIEDEVTLGSIQMLKLTTENLKQTLNNYVDTLSQKGGLIIEVEAINLSDCLNKVLTSVKSLLQDMQASVSIDFTAFEQVVFNKTYMESILLNLISNALKYARPGHHPEISVYTRINNGSRQLIVADKGLGMDMEKVKNKIFGFQHKFHAHNDSKGIGLYLVYNHIVSLGGQIEVESRINEGTSFIITFKE